MMCIKVINMNNEILKTLLDPGDNFNVTLMGEICKLKSKLLHLRMHESSSWKEVVSAEYIQAVIFTQIPSDALTNSSLSNYLPLIIAKAFSICSGYTNIKPGWDWISLRLMFIYCYICVVGLYMLEWKRCRICCHVSAPRLL